MFFILTSTIGLNYIFIYQTNIYIRIICFVNVFDLFIPAIMLKMLTFKFSVLFRIDTFLDKSFGVLQLPTHLPNLIENG